jgi:uncharacterized RDD family membrane protein YckC
MQPLYGTIPRRLNGLVLDSLVLLAIVGAFMTLGAAFDWSPNARKVLFAAMIITPILYEPILVSRYGATLGHRWQNLRVVADRGGFPSFPRALLRWLAKLPLGAFALFSIPATQRHQAVHDLVARTTVQIHDPSRAPSHTYAAARPAVGGVLPSRGRRVLVVAGYEVVLFLAVSAASYLGSTDACLVDNDCTARENVWNTALGVVWLSLAVLLAAFGMTGRLWGARRQPADASPSPAAT